MKYTVIIDKEREEEIVLYLRERSELADRIEKLITSHSADLVGYRDGQIVPIPEDSIYSVFVEDGKLYVTTDKDKLRLYERLYTVEERLSGSFVKINQSCIVCVKKIARFDVSVGGNLTVIMKNGYKDYVSRRQLKAVKERIGFRL